MAATHEQYCSVDGVVSLESVAVSPGSEGQPPPTDRRPFPANNDGDRSNVRSPRGPRESLRAYTGVRGHIQVARTYVGTRSREQAETPAAASVNGTLAAAPPASLPQAAERAYELTDAEGRRAYVWWDGDTPTVDSHSPVLRRRVRRALRKPIWVREDEPDEFGVSWSTLIQLQPDDPRYADRLLFRWGQIGLDDVGVQVVTLPDRQPVRPRAR